MVCRLALQQHQLEHAAPLLQAWQLHAQHQGLQQGPCHCSGLAHACRRQKNITWDSLGFGLDHVAPVSCWSVPEGMWQTWATVIHVQADLKGPELLSLKFCVPTPTGCSDALRALLSPDASKGHA